MIKTVLNITEICGLMQNMDHLALPGYLNFIIRAVQTQIESGTRMGQTMRVLRQEVPYSTGMFLDLSRQTYYESVFSMNEGTVKFHQK